MSENQHMLERSFRALVDGKSDESPLSKTKCVYFETATFYFQGRKLMAWSSDYCSQNDIFVLVGEEARIRVWLNKLRAYLDPHLKEETPDKSHYRVVKAEYVLLPRKEYHFLITSERYRLPPEKPGSRPRLAHEIVLWVSNLEFQDGEPRVEITPRYKDWMH
ncbi:MAG: hypothetical protein ACXQS8_09820 [Candidatus Helarchaeales archaeon]